MTIAPCPPRLANEGSIYPLGRDDTFSSCAEGSLSLSGISIFLYSAECVEYRFCELRLLEILGSSATLAVFATTVCYNRRKCSGGELG